MGVITKVMKQTAVYWPLASEESGGVDFGEYGQPQFASPMEIDCRWDDEIRNIVDAEGTMKVSKAEVMVSVDVDLGGLLMLGMLDDITDEENPRENAGAEEIIAFEKNPNFRATEFLRVAYL